jgi:hypothetical protein
MLVHVISNLDLKFHEFTPIEDEVIPDGTDLVIFCGGFSNRMKRSLLYCETLIQKYPDVKFIMNMAPIDHYMEVPDILYSAMRVRYENSPLRNLHYSKEPFQTNDYDILTLVGWPKVNQVPEKLEKVFGAPRPRYLKDGECCNTQFRYFVSSEEMNAFYQQERHTLEEWLATDSGKQKILVTGTAPLNDPYAGEYKLYEDLNLSGIIWIHGGNEIYDKTENHTRLICNPGRGLSRSNTFIV